MKPAFDPRLYLVTDRDMLAGRSLVDVVAAAVRGGVTVVQLREKHCGTREFIAVARALQPLLAAHRVPLLINDRVDVALAVQADGVHLGQSDMEYADARRLLGPDALIGISIETPAQAEGVEADYLGVGPIFSTATKPDAAPAWGLETLRAFRVSNKSTLVAIGGIHLANAPDVMEAGADGVAVVSALCAAPDPEAAARALLRAISPRS